MKRSVKVKCPYCSRSGGIMIDFEKEGEMVLAWCNALNDESCHRNFVVRATIKVEIETFQLVKLVEKEGEG